MVAEGGIDRNLSIAGVSRHLTAGARQTAFLSILVILLSYEAIATLTHLARISVFPEIGKMAVWVNGALLLFSLFCLRFRGSLWRVNLLLLVLLGYGVAVGIIHRPPLNRPFFGHLYHWSVMFIGLNLGYGMVLPSRRILQLFRIYSHVILGLSAVGYVLLELYRSSSPTGIYVGYSASQLLLPVCYFVCNGNWFRCAMAFLVILLTGKRGPFLASLAILAYGPFLVRFRSRKAVALGGTLLLLLLAAMFWGLLWTAADPLRTGPDSSVGRVVWKWVRTFQDWSLDPDVATAGRNMELEHAFSLVETPESLLVGRGFGWYIQPDRGWDPQHYVHFGYVNYLITYGIIGTVAVLFFLGWIVWYVSGRAIRACRPEDAQLLRILSLYLVGALILSATVSLLSVSFLFWILAGIGLQIASLPGEQR